MVNYCTISTDRSWYVTRYLTCSRGTLFVASCCPLQGENLFVHTKFWSEITSNISCIGFSASYLRPSLTSIQKFNYHIAAGSKFFCFHGLKTLFCNMFIPHRYTLHLVHLFSSWPTALHVTWTIGRNSTVILHEFCAPQNWPLPAVLLRRVDWTWQ